MDWNDALKAIFDYESTIARPGSEKWVRSELVNHASSDTRLVPSFGLPKGDATRSSYFDYAEKCVDYLRFGYEVDACIAGLLSRYDDVMVRKDTPELLCELGCKDLPMLETQRHLLDEMHPISVATPSWHGLDKRLIKEVPELLESPCIVMDSLSERGGIVCVLDALDDSDTPVIVPFIPDGFGHYQSQGVASNFILSIYGKNGISDYVSRAEAAGNLLYVNTMKTENLMSCAGLQLPRACMRLDGIIQQTSHAGNTDLKPEKAVPAPKSKIAASPSAQTGSDQKQRPPREAARQAPAPSADQQAMSRAATVAPAREAARANAVMKAAR